MCEYCGEKEKDFEVEKMFRVQQEIYISITKGETNKYTLDVGVFNPDAVVIANINYCPMCGRKLNES